MLFHNSALRSRVTFRGTPPLTHLCVPSSHQRLTLRHGAHHVSGTSTPLRVQLSSRTLTPASATSSAPAAACANGFTEALQRLSSGSRVVITGAGASELLPQLLAHGVDDILVVLPPLSASASCQQLLPYVQHSTLGNTLGVRTWEGRLEDLPAFMGAADAVFLTDSHLGSSSSDSIAATAAEVPLAVTALTRSLLLRVAFLLRPGGHVVCSLLPPAPPAQAHDSSACLPQLQALVWDLPLRVSSWGSLVTGGCLAVLQAPLKYTFKGAPLRLDGPVVRGFGRGSRKMGTATANIAPALLLPRLVGMPRGVYFGWAQLDAPAGWPAADRAVHKVVLNIGSRPTLNEDAEDVTIECHILHAFTGGDEFYGSSLRVLALGFVRPEMRFAGLPQLVSRIKADIAVARLQMDDPEAQACKTDAFLSG